MNELTPPKVLTPEDELKQRIVRAIKTVYDPEIPVDVYELGLIYDINVNDPAAVKVDMTLTAPGCPVAGILPGWVKDAVETVEGVENAEVELVWDPPWSMENMTMRAKLELGML